jgi:hypothetical protein
MTHAGNGASGVVWVVMPGNAIRSLDRDLNGVVAWDGLLIGELAQPTRASAMARMMPPSLAGTASRLIVRSMAREIGCCTGAQRFAARKATPPCRQLVKNCFRDGDQNDPR